MALNLTLTGVNPHSVVFQPMLKDLQANIIKGHGRSYAYHIFLQLLPAKKEAAKKWIADFASSKITSALSFEEGRQSWKSQRIDGGSVCTLSISATGYTALGFEDEQLPIEKETIANSIVRDVAAFKNGAKGNAAKLGDGDITSWEKAYQNNIDFLIIVADNSPAKALELSEEIIADVFSFSKVCMNQKGQLLQKNVTTGASKERIILEHFGYADGISQPMFMKDEIDAQQSTNEWNDGEPLNLVLVPDPNGKTEDSFGSFLVYRKLEQNVAGFMHAEEKLLPAIKDTNGNVNKDLAGAMMVGRFRNGNVLVKSNGITDNTSLPSLISNDFNNSSDPKTVSDIPSYSSKCPYFSHIRLTNPRADMTVVPPSFAHSVRLTRRAIPYDDIGRFGPGNEDLINPTDEQLNSCRPSGGVGLLFMSYQAHIGKQFEFIQNNWANHGHIAGHNVGPDGIIGQVSPVPQGLPFKPATPNFLPKKLPAQWGEAIAPSSSDISFSGFVKMKGGEYFFTPSISFLQSLGDKL